MLILSPASFTFLGLAIVSDLSNYLLCCHYTIDVYIVKDIGKVRFLLDILTARNK